MPIPWIIGGLIVAGVAAAVASSDDADSSSSSRDADRERERARRDNERKVEEAQQRANDQRRASENKAKAQRFVTTHKLDLKPEALISAIEQDNQLSLLVMDSYNNKESVRCRNREIAALEQDLEALERLEAEL